MKPFAPLLISARRHRGSAALGLLVFLVGVALIGFSFKLAYDLFLTPPEVAMRVTPGQPINIDQTAASLTQLVVRILILAVMAGLGSMIANRGIRLYAARPAPAQVAEPKRAEPESESPSRES